MRHPPKWFEPADEIILDYVFEREPTTPGPIADYSNLEWDYIMERAGMLAEAGLLKTYDESIFSVTELGKDYLFGRADLEGLAKP